MWFWWFMFFFNTLIPLTLIVAGQTMRKHCSKDINSVIGYRTKRSMKNADTWKFANEYCGRSWWKLGWIMLFPTVCIQIPFYTATEAFIGNMGGALCAIQCVLMIASIVPTEKALKKTFDANGKRK